MTCRLKMILFDIITQVCYLRRPNIWTHSFEKLAHILNNDKSRPIPFKKNSCNQWRNHNSKCSGGSANENYGEHHIQAYKSWGTCPSPWLLVVVTREFVLKNVLFLQHWSFEFLLDFECYTHSAMTPFWRVDHLPWARARFCLIFQLFLWGFTIGPFRRDTTHPELNISIKI